MRGRPGRLAGVQLNDKVKALGFVETTIRAIVVRGINNQKLDSTPSTGHGDLIRRDLAAKPKRPMGMTIDSASEALELLRSLKAPARLTTHVALVREAGQELADGLSDLEVPFDRQFVEIGIALHDAGKITHPEELDHPGNLHEPAGQALLLARGVDPGLARCCLSHARFNSMPVSFEELLVAAADKLWKGKRVVDLELRIIDEAASRLQSDRWSLFTDIDSLFEKVAARGSCRLARSA